MPIKAEAIYCMLAQRYPFLLIDRITELSGTQVRGRKAVSLNDYFYSMLPEKPERRDFAYPDALLIETLAQSAGLLLRESWEQLRSDRHVVMFGAFSGISIHSHAFPGDTLDIEANLDVVGEDAAVISGNIWCDNRLILQANSISAALRPASIYEKA